jgi:hypothetical protein
MGFGHSCETALHKLVSDLNTIRDKKLIAMLLFIDFRKAFDLVDSHILLAKLFCSNMALATWPSTSIATISANVSSKQNREIVIFFLTHQAWRAARECPRSTLLSSLHQRPRLLHARLIRVHSIHR